MCIASAHFIGIYLHLNDISTAFKGQLETVEMKTGNGKWKRKTETVET